MASEKKKRKLKNSYCGYWALKAKGKDKLKRVLFFTEKEGEKAPSFRWGMNHLWLKLDF